MVCSCSEKLEHVTLLVASHLHANQHHVTQLLPLFYAKVTACDYEDG